MTTARHAVMLVNRALPDLLEHLEQPVQEELQELQGRRVQGARRASQGQTATQGQQVFLAQRDSPELLETLDRLEQLEQKEQPG